MSPTGAIGPGQFTKDTWNYYVATPEGRAIGMKPITAGNFRTAADPRRNSRINILATALYARDNTRELARHHLPAAGENLYMLHNIGSGVIPALKGSNHVSNRTVTAMRHNGMRSGETPAQFAVRQKAIFNSHYAAANSDGNTAYRQVEGRSRKPRNRKS